MRFEQHIGSNCRAHFVGGEVGESDLRMLADISVRPTVKPSIFDMRKVVRRQAVAETVAFLHQGVDFAGLRLKRERGRIAHTDAKVVCSEPSAAKRWIVAFGAGSTPTLPEEPTPTNNAPVFGSIASGRF